ncbi:hypothetical protein D3C73_901220 [compost metagenome]
MLPFTALSSLVLSAGDVATGARLSLMLTVAGVVLATINALLVAAFIVKITVSFPSLRLSSSTGTEMVTVVCPAGIVTVVPMAV